MGEERVKEARLQTLKSEFDGLRMKDDESIDSYAGKLTSMSVRYANLGGSLDDAALVKKMFDTTPEKYIHVIAGIEQFFDLKKIAFDEAIVRLKAFEERTKRGAGGSRSKPGQVLLTQAEWEARQKKSTREGLVVEGVMAVAVDGVVATAVEAVGVAVMAMVAEMARGSVTKATSSVLSATPMDTMPTGVQEVKRRRKKRRIMSREWNLNRQCCLLKRRSRDSSSAGCRKTFRFSSSNV